MSPLVQPDNLREKSVIIGGAGAGKSSAHLSIAWWAFQSGDTRKFWILDTDDEAIQHVLNDPKYAGMLQSVNGELVNEGGNIILFSASTWSDYQNFSDKAVANTVKGDFIVIDFVSHVWAEAQNGFLQDSIKKTRDKALYEAGVAGKVGWSMYETDFNWQAINGAYFSMMKPILISSRAHVVMTAEEEEIQDARNMTAGAKEHIAQFGRFKAAGVQKKIPFQCRSYLRIQRLARGRVLHTLKDRARSELAGDNCKDFLQDYLVKCAGWKVTDPE